jgi:hypothetical protein
MVLNFAPFGTDNDFNRLSGTGPLCIAMQARGAWLLSACPSGTKTILPSKRLAMNLALTGHCSLLTYDWLSSCHSDATTHEMVP